MSIESSALTGKSKSKMSVENSYGGGKHLIKTDILKQHNQKK